MDYKSRLTELSDSIKCNSVHIKEVPEEEEKKGTKVIFEKIIVENIPNLGKQTDSQTQEAQGTPIKNAGQHQDIL